MDLKLVLPLSPFIYAEWKLKMVACLKSHELFDLSIGSMAMPKSDEQKNDWINDYDSAYGKMCLAMSRKMWYLIYSVEYPFELSRNPYRDFGVQKEVDDTWRESNTSSRVLPSNVSASILSNEVVQDE